MQKLFVIGNLGSDAERRIKDGKEFVTFKVADTSRWTDQRGDTHESTIWISCIINGDGGRVVEFLKTGVKVFVEGRPSYRVYSSQKDRCMKASVDLNVTSIELAGGSADSVPSRLVDTDGALHDVKKFYWVEGLRSCQMFGERKGAFTVDDNGFIFPIAEQPAEQPTEQQESTPEIF